MKLPDSIIAATAYYLGIPLISADKDFMVVKEINFIAYMNEVEVFPAFRAFFAFHVSHIEDFSRVSRFAFLAFS